MTAVEDAIAAARVQWDDLRGSGGPILPHVTAVATLTVAINQAVDSGHLIAADDTEGLQAALLRLGALEQIGHSHTNWERGEEWQGMIPSPTHSHFKTDDMRDGVIECADCPDCVPVYRFKGEQA